MVEIELSNDASSPRVAVMVLQSPLLERHGFHHGFSTRMGGVSSAPFESLNLGFPLQAGSLAQYASEPARIEENLRRFLAACGLSSRRPVRVRQVHGATTLDARDVSLAETTCDADALAASLPEHAILVRVADCVPILIASTTTGHVAAVHAGWRGIVGGVIESALARLRAWGTESHACVAAIGPSIGVSHYEVGEEVAEAFERRGLRFAIDRSGLKPHAHCHHAARAILVREGVPDAMIDGEPMCTFADPDRFFSARRDGAISGRMAAVIAPRVSCD